jgi:hypothetical protein
MTTLSPAPYPGYGWGIQFNAKLTDTNLSGNPVFIQNLTNVDNGVIGPTTNSSGQRVGATFDQATNPLGQDFVISAAAQQNGAAFPLLDTPTDTGNPEYPVMASGTSNDGNSATIQAVDSPTLDATNSPLDGTALDVQYRYKLYLVWKYPSGIYYPLGYYNWWVKWYATASRAPNSGPVDTIQYPSAVYTDATWIPDNSTPGKMIAPIAFGSFVWQ